MLCASSLPDSRSRAPQGPASQNRAGLPWPVLGGSVTMVSGTATPVLTIAKGESLLTVTVATPFPTNHCFSQIVICGNCGEVFRRVHWNNRGKKSIVWRCVSRLENTGLFCDARNVLDSTICSHEPIFLQF